MSNLDIELNERMERILTATANALHGGYAPPDCLHSWHDLPELVEKLRKERDEARREILESMHPDLRESYAAAREWNCCKKNGIVSEPKRAVPPKFDLNEDEKS